MLVAPPYFSDYFALFIKDRRFLTPYHCNKKADFAALEHFLCTAQQFL